MQELCLGCMNPIGAEQVCPVCGYQKGTPPKESYHLKPGTLLRKYLIGRVLGYGGFGVTYLGYDTQFDIRVAIKEYLPGEYATRIPGDLTLTVYSGEKGTMFANGRAKFIDEARRLAQFSGEAGVVSILDEFDANGTCYIVMEYLEGETLKERLKRVGKISAEEAVQIMLPVLDALTVVHAKGIIHRDISPDNIFLTNDGKVKLLDFGAARYASAGQSKSLSIILKPGYAPEEQYRSHGEQGPWSDVYACAATMYKAITGVTPEDALERAVRDEVKPLTKMHVRISREQSNAIMNAMNIFREDRTQSAAEFKSQLIGAQKVRRQKQTHHADGDGWRTWQKAALLSAAGGLILTVGLSLAFQNRQPPRPKDLSSIGGVNHVWVPDLTHIYESQARKMITDAGLTPEIREGDYSDTLPAGMVVNQSPLAGQGIEKNMPVEITMSLGKQKVQLDDMTGMTASEAKLLLIKRGFDAVVYKSDFSDAPDGETISQSLEPGSYPKGTQVMLFASMGLSDKPDAGKTLTVGNYSGWEFEKVREELADELIYVKRNYVTSFKPADTVVGQSAAPDSKVQQGSVITLDVSAGSRKFTAEDYHTLNYHVARCGLALNGQNALLQYEISDLYHPELVMRQSIPAGTETVPGESVILTVSLKNIQGMTVPESAKTLPDSGLSWNYENRVLTIYGNGSMPEWSEKTGAPWHTAEIMQNCEYVLLCGNIQSVGAYAFADLAALKTVVVPGTSLIVQEGAFSGCTALETVLLPEDLTEIGADAFSDCESLKTVYFAGTEADWNAIAFADAEPLPAGADLITADSAVTD